MEASRGSKPGPLPWFLGLAVFIAALVALGLTWVAPAYDEKAEDCSPQVVAIDNVGSCDDATKQTEIRLAASFAVAGVLALGAYTIALAEV